MVRNSACPKCGVLVKQLNVMRVGMAGIDPAMRCNVQMSGLPFGCEKCSLAYSTNCVG
jgi:hypothetical protein